MIVSNSFCRSADAAGAYTDWPTGRGVFHNDDKSFLAWVGGDEHLTVISMQAGVDFAAVYKRIVKVSEIREVYLLLRQLRI
jgi:hypothetical protein